MTDLRFSMEDVRRLVDHARTAEMKDGGSSFSARGFSVPDWSARFVRDEKGKLDKLIAVRSDGQDPEKLDRYEFKNTPSGWRRTDPTTGRFLARGRPNTHDAVVSALHQERAAAPPAAAKLDMAKENSWVGAALSRAARDDALAGVQRINGYGNPIKQSADPVIFAPFEPNPDMNGADIRRSIHSWPGKTLTGTYAAGIAAKAALANDKSPGGARRRLSIDAGLRALKGELIHRGLDAPDSRGGAAQKSRGPAHFR